MNPKTMEITPLHQLIRQASDVVRNLTKARRSDEADLREQAQSTLAALDSDHPGQSAVQQVWQLVRDLSNADEKSFDSMKSASICAPPTAKPMNNSTC
jgi:hypothetical protein